MLVTRCYLIFSILINLLSSHIDINLLHSKLIEGGMLVYQGAITFKLFIGLEVLVEIMKKAVYNKLYAIAKNLVKEISFINIILIGLPGSGKSLLWG